MKLSMLFTVSAIADALYGVAVIVAPAPFLAIYGVQLDVAGVAMTRLLGAALIGFAWANWSMRSVTDAAALRGLVLGNLLTAVVATAILTHSTVTGLANALGWSTVALYAAFSAGWAYFAFMRPAAAATRPAP